MIRYHARWVLPIAAPPIRDGVVVVDAGRIVEVGEEREAVARPEPRRGAERSFRNVDLGNVAILPGLVNAHTHLELSYLHEAVPPAGEFVTWIRGVMAARRQRPDPRAPEIVDAVARAIAQAAACGTALVGDISNTLVTWQPLAASGIGGVVFYELIKFNVADARAFVADAVQAIDRLGEAATLRASLAAHAPYSVAPAVFDEIRAVMAGREPLPCSVHLSESPDEVRFLADASGPWRALLEHVGAWDPRWKAPGVSPVQYLDAAGFLNPRLIAVHGVQMDQGDLATLARQGTTLVTCPRSNRHTGAGTPPVAAFYASGVPVAVGTDSLASAPDLNVFAELAALRAIAPEVAPSRLLESATRIGAEALGFGHEYGTIEPGKRARLLAVAVPPDERNVEEFLVGGVTARDIRWLQ